MKNYLICLFSLISLGSSSLAYSSFNNVHQLKDGKCYYIVNSKDQFLSASKEYGLFFTDIGNRTSFCIEFHVKDMNFILLRSIAGEYLSFNENQIGVTSESKENAEGLLVTQRANGSFNLETLNHENLIYSTNSELLTLSSESVKEDNQLYFVTEPTLQVGQCYSLETQDGHEIGFDQHTNVFRVIDGPQEPLCVGFARNDQISLKSASGYLCAYRWNSGVGAMHWTKEWESFQASPSTNGSISLKTFHKTYLNLDTQTGALSQTAALPETGSGLFFVPVSPTKVAHAPFHTSRAFHSPQDTEARKVDFLTHTRFEKVPNRPFFNYNSIRNADLAPLSPVVHCYQSPNPFVPLTVKLPQVFWTHLPEEIKVALAPLKINQLDILFTPQWAIEGMSICQAPENNTSLKPAYWAYPEMPKLASVEGQAFYGILQMGIFNSEHPIDAQVISNSMKDFEVNVHDGAISPNTGHLYIDAQMMDFGFWSIVYYPQEARAAATLHWMLKKQSKEVLIRELDKVTAHAPDHAMNHLIQELETSGVFRASLLDQLKNLVGVAR